MLSLPVILVSLFILAVASYTDLKTLEVPDWLNYSGIAAGLGIALIFSAQQWSWQPILSSSIGLAIAFAVACLMYYTGQWGGGDAKLLMAMGALIGFQPSKFAFGTSYLINLAFTGALWSVLWSGGLAVNNATRFKRTFLALRNQKAYARLRITTLFTATGFIILAFLLPLVRLPLLGLALITYVLCYLTIFIKSVELSSMHQWITPDKLTEGDWLVHAVKAGTKKVIPARTGLQPDQVKTLKKLHHQGKLDNVLVKYGVPFIPAFLFAFIVTLLYGNVVLAFIVGNI